MTKDRKACDGFVAMLNLTARDCSCESKAPAADRGHRRGRINERCFYIGLNHCIKCSGASFSTSNTPNDQWEAALHRTRWENIALLWGFRWGTQMIMILQHIRTYEKNRRPCTCDSEKALATEGLHPGYACQPQHLIKVFVCIKN